MDQILHLNRVFLEVQISHLRSINKLTEEALVRYDVELAEWYLGQREIVDYDDHNSAAAIDSRARRTYSSGCPRRSASRSSPGERFTGLALLHRSSVVSHRITIETAATSGQPAQPAP